MTATGPTGAVWPVIALATIGVLCVLLAGVAWESRRASSLAMPLVALFLAIGVWNGAYALHLGGAPGPTPDFWNAVSYLGIVAIPAGVLVLAVRLTGRGTWPGRGVAAALAVEPLLLLAALATDFRYDLVYDGERDPALIPTASGGIGFWVNLVYSFVLVAIAAALVAHRIGTTHGIMRRQTIAVFVAILVPWAVTAGGLFRPANPGVDLTPPSMAVSVLAVAFALFRYRLLAFTPVARHAMFDFMADAALALDAEDRITDLNPAAASMFQVDRNEVRGRSVAEALAHETDLVGLLDEHDDGPAEATLVALPGHVVEARVTTVTDRSGWPIGRLVLCRDITDRKELEEQLATLAAIDPLTGVGNRRALEADWVRERARSERRGEPLACVVLDLDDFKQLNDTDGHAAGDHALVVFARTLEQQVRRVDSVARIGGDEFVVLMPATSAAEAGQVMRRVADEVDRQLGAELGANRISVSAGVTQVAGPLLAEALARADEALYRAKQAGPATISVSEPHHGDSG